MDFKRGSMNKLRFHDFDFRRFKWPHWVLALQPLLLIGMVVRAYAGAAQDFQFWLAFTGNVALTVFGLFFFAYPRKDGSSRGLAEPAPSSTK
jgi:hypothetical protein